ncbi:hypothetical protein [Aeromicrobium sp.]
MSTSDKKRRPLRKLVFLAVVVGTAIAIKNALEDKGGSYEPPAAEQPSTESVPTPPAPSLKVVTAADIVEPHPVENLDEFADSVEPAAKAEPKRASAPVAAADADVSDADDTREIPGKIDPFGIR